ncbi:hypothetical protein BDW74DRAFT_4707 [Aspergillus multicolor]|uniref:cell envelope integrity protein TolA n=1 Tax=Aspergillus multicolor TaxID=41759 RepID=UPI003CCE3265
MKDTISQVLNQCLRDFTALTESEALNRYEAEIPRRRWLDELGRLRVWSGNIGAHQAGQSSLDYRLRDASHLKGETLKLLNRMLRVIQNATEVLNEDSDGEVGIELEDDEDDGTTEMQQLHQNIVDIINSLMQISMAVRRPADHDRLLNMKVKNESFFAPWAQQHISHKYPDAEAATVDRLSLAMARQKAILKYRERHRAKLEKGLFEYIETNSTKLSETIATEMVANNDRLQFLETTSNSGLSQTSYAPSLMATQAAASIPNPPKGSANRNPCECPYCYHIITIKHKKDWARHVFQDLMPYVCLSSDCVTPSRLYDSRHQWSLHMREAHGHGQQGLTCPLCHTGIPQSTSFEKHVGRHLEELALFVLPRTESEGEVSSEGSTLDPVETGERLALASDDGLEDEPALGYSIDEEREFADTSSATTTSTETSAAESENGTNGPYRCTYPGCTAPPFMTRYLFKCHSKVHSQVRPHFCSVEGCPRGPDRKGFKRKNEMLRHGLFVHGDPGYTCPFCPDDSHKYPRPDKLQLHVLLHHPNQRRDDPALQRILSQAPMGDNRRDSSAETVSELQKIPQQAEGPSPDHSEGARVADSARGEHHEWLAELQKTIDEDEEKRRIKKEIRDEEARIALAEQGEKAKEARIKASAVEEGKLQQERAAIAALEATEKCSDESKDSLPHKDEIGPEHILRLREEEENKEIMGNDHESVWIVEFDAGSRMPEGLATFPPRSKRGEMTPQSRLSNPASSNAAAVTGDVEGEHVRPELKGILRAPREKFPEDPNPEREGVARLKDATDGGIPPGARWTKIDRRLVNPAALEAGRERFEERGDSVIVLRVLTREEIQEYANNTQEIRAMVGNSDSERGRRQSPLKESIQIPPESRRAALRAGNERSEEIYDSVIVPGSLEKEIRPYAEKTEELRGMFPSIHKPYIS